MIHIKIRDFLTVFCVLRSGVFIEDGFARRTQGPSTSVKKESEFKELLSLLSAPPLTGQRPPVAIGGHATYSGTGPGMQQVMGKPTESSATLPAPIRVGQIQETRASHSWRPVMGHPVSAGRAHSWRSVRGHPVSSTGRGNSWGPVRGRPVYSSGRGHSLGPVMQHPVTSTGKGHSWQAITGHHVGSTRRGHSWRSVRGHPMTSTRRVHSWRPVTRHPVASTGKVQPVEAIPSPQLHVIEPVNRSWKTGREGAITCELCAYTTERKEKYIEHLRCNITQRYMCKICGRACLQVNIFVTFFIINCHIFLLLLSSCTAANTTAGEGFWERCGGKAGGKSNFPVSGCGSSSRNELAIS